MAVSTLSTLPLTAMGVGTADRHVWRCKAIDTITGLPWRFDFVATGSEYQARIVALYRAKQQFEHGSVRIDSLSVLQRVENWGN